MALGENGFGIALDVALLAGLVKLSRAAGDVAGGDTASGELVGAVGKVGALDGAQESAALGNLLGEIVAGMGNGAGEEGEAGGDG